MDQFEFRGWGGKRRLAERQETGGEEAFLPDTGSPDSARRRHRLSLSHKQIPQRLPLGRAGLSGGGEAETRRAPQNLFGAQEDRGVDHSAVDCGCAEGAPRA